MGDPPPDACEVCGEGPVSVVLFPVAAHFKGSGFYSTDYGRGSRKKESKEEAGASSSSDGSSSDSKAGEEKKSETKAAEA